jgi:hypothetical protein
MFDNTSLHFLYISTLEILVHNINTILYCNFLFKHHEERGRFERCVT